MLIGAHVGVAAGYPQAVDYAVSVGCECMQVFCKSPRQWAARPLDVAIASAFRRRVEACAMGPVLVHTAYLINLGSVDDELWHRSIVALGDELARAGMLGATAVVTHVGTAAAGDLDRAARRVAHGVDAAWQIGGSSPVRLLLENTAGAGSTFGDGPEELGSILRHLGEAAGSVGVCLDTCHAHAAGWDLSRSENWTRLLDDFEECCGMPVEAIHANDCAYAPGEHRDRHAWIGDGTIGYEGFAAMLSQARLSGVPVVTEMPGEVPEKDVENVSRLKRLRDASGVL